MLAPWLIELKRFETGRKPAPKSDKSERKEPDRLMETICSDSDDDDDDGAKGTQQDEDRLGATFYSDDDDDGKDDD